jgi:secreted PhoX family phosphatase
MGSLFAHRRAAPLASTALALVALCAASVGNPVRAADSTVESVEFVGMAAPSIALDMTRTYSAASAVVHYKGGEQKTVPLEYHVLYHNTDKVGSNPYQAGQLYDAFGNPLTDPFGAPLVAETPDGTSLFAIAGAPSSASGEANLYLVTQYEYDWLLSDGSEASDKEGWYSRAPSAMNLTTIAQNPNSGALTATDQSNIDFSGVGGLWIPCAASQTPWGTHLAGEEDYDFFRHDLVDASVKDMTELYLRNTDQARPYGYGYPVEVAVRADGGTSVFKHYSMGHASWEKAQIMPDRRTAYYGDDGTNTGLFMYVANKPGQLGAGTLYAARWDQESDQNGGSAKLTWIRLGHATDYEVADMIDQESLSSDESTILEFSDEAASDLTAIRAGTKKDEYVKVRPGKEKAAAFLESRRYAALQGATTEFNKMEGVTLDPQEKKVYLAMSYMEKAMTPNDGGPKDDVRIPELKAGGVYELSLEDGVKDSDGQPIDGDWVATRMAGVPELMGVDLAEMDDLGNTADPDKIANPDNLSFSPAMRTLFIGEDSGMHANNFVWAFNVDTRKLSRILSVPMGAEATGLQVVDNINGHGYVMSNYQHAGERIDIKDEALKTEVENLTDRFKTAIGYVGGLPGVGAGQEQFASR